MAAFGYTMIIFRLVAGNIESEVGRSNMLWSACQAEDRRLMASATTEGAPHAWVSCVKTADMPVKRQR